MCVPEGVNTRSLVGMVSYAHVTGFLRSMLNVVSVICSLMSISVCTSYYCELVVGLRVQF
jgi:hypothetical protein